MSYLPLQVYVNYTFLLVVLFFLASVTAMIAMALTYYQLTVGDYAWWWRSFILGGSTGEL
jgi:transmembrane 9 superfamily protein 2/4